MGDLKLAVLGATGIVGQAMLKTILRRLAGLSVCAFATNESVLKMDNRSFTVRPLATINFNDFDVVLSALPAEVAEVYLLKAIACNCFVVDNSSAFRNSEQFSLVVPEVNGALVEVDSQLVASPNCIAIPLAMALKPLQDIFTLVKVDVATYQAVSGAGYAAVDELKQTSLGFLQNGVASHQEFVAPIGFNVIPYIDLIEENGCSREELKIYNETRKLLNNDALDLNVSAVRVPVFNGHSQAVHCTLAEDVSLEQIVDIFANSPGVELIGNSEYLTPMTHITAENDVLISRVRMSLTNAKAFNFWLVADNVYKGAALNAVQIVECWLEQKLLQEI